MPHVSGEELLQIAQLVLYLKLETINVLKLVNFLNYSTLRNRLIRENDSTFCSSQVFRFALIRHAAKERWLSNEESPNTR